jgi:hypothetical protein
MCKAMRKVFDSIPWGTKLSIRTFVKFGHDVKKKLKIIIFLCIAQNYELDLAPSPIGLVILKAIFFADRKV